MSEHPDFDDRKPDDEPVERPDEGQPLNPFSPDDKEILLFRYSRI